MNDESHTDESKEESTWLRLVFILLFAVAFNIASYVLALVVLVQFLAKVFSGRTMPAVTGFGQNLATYVYGIIRFLTFRSSDMPWPFAPWPDGPPSAEGQRRPEAAPAGATAEGAATE